MGGGVCIDIGSNVGSFLSEYADKFKVIYFYEAQKKCFDICVSLNFKNAVGFNEAVFKESGVLLEMVEHYNHSSGSVALKTDSINNDWTENSVNKVVTVDLETVLKRAGGMVDYMKIDCETSEYYFLFDKDLSSISYIGIELHCQMGEDRYNKLLSHLEKTHYTNDDVSYCINLNREALYTRKNKL